MEEGQGGLISVTDATVVTLPGDSSDPVAITTDAATLSITLPSSEVAAEASISDNNNVEYDNADGSVTTALPKDDGSLQITTTIDHVAAPAAYSYEVDVPEGYTLEASDGGGVGIVSADGTTILGAFAAPWAKDAAGREVTTHYEVVGDTLTQVVDHATTLGVQYPVVADPWLGVDLYFNPTITFTTQGWRVNATPTSQGKGWTGPATWFAHRDELKSKLAAKNQAHRWNTSIQEQLYCHLAGYPLSLPTYNLESWRPIMNWADQAPYFCNYPEGGVGS